MRVWEAFGDAGINPPPTADTQFTVECSCGWDFSLARATFGQEGDLFVYRCARCIEARPLVLVYPFEDGEPVEDSAYRLRGSIVAPLVDLRYHMHGPEHQDRVPAVLLPATPNGVQGALGRGLDIGERLGGA